MKNEIVGKFLTSQRSVDQRRKIAQPVSIALSLSIPCARHWSMAVACLHSVTYTQTLASLRFGIYMPPQWTMPLSTLATRQLLCDARCVCVRAAFALSANNFGWPVVFKFISIIIYKTSLAGNKMVKWTSGKSRIMVSLEVEESEGREKERRRHKKGHAVIFR